MTETIVEYLRDLAATIGGIETSHCLAERRSISTDEPTEIPYIYTGDGGYIPVEVDSGSVSYFRLVNPISFDEVDGRTPVKALKGSYPFTFVAMVRRDDNNPLTYSQDVANLFEGRNKDLASILKASSVHVTVSSIETDTPKIWKQEFQVPATTPNYTRSMVMIELTVDVVANRDCWVNCADYPDILQGFPWCAKPAATLARLTTDQRDCLSDELCGVIPDGSATNSNGSFTIDVPSGVDVPLPNITKTDSDGTTSSIPSNEDVMCTLSPTIPTLTIRVFNSDGDEILTANYKDDVTITIETSIDTPTEYRFNVFGRAWVTTVQAGASLSYTIDTLNDLIIYAEAKDATTVAASIPSKSIAVVNTLAAAFIARSNTLASDTMAAYQQGVVGTAYKIANGIGSPNGSDLLDLLIGSGAVLFPYIPTSDTVASAGAYSVDFLNAANTCEFVGFVSGDFIPSGLAGGVGKYTKLGVAPDDFNQNSLCCTVIGLVDNATNNITMGAVDGSTRVECYKKHSSLGALTRINLLASAYLYDSSPVSSDAVISFNLSDGGNSIYIDGAKRDLTFFNGPNNVASGAEEIYAHCVNANGSPGTWDGDRVGGFGITRGLSKAEIEDWQFLCKYIKDNIITGGR